MGDETGHTDEARQKLKRQTLEGGKEERKQKFNLLNQVEV